MKGSSVSRLQLKMISLENVKRISTSALAMKVLQVCSTQPDLTPPPVETPVIPPISDNLLSSLSCPSSEPYGKIGQVYF